MKQFCISLHFSTNYSRDFLVKAETLKDALAKLNYKARQVVKKEKLVRPNDDYGMANRMADVVKTIRRVRRRHKDKFGACFLTRLSAFELDEIDCMEVSLDPSRDRLVRDLWDKLPRLESEFLR